MFDSLWSEILRTGDLEQVIAYDRFLLDNIAWFIGPIIDQDDEYIFIMKNEIDRMYYATTGEQLDWSTYQL